MGLRRENLHLRLYSFPLARVCSSKPDCTLMHCLLADSPTTSTGSRNYAIYLRQAYSAEPAVGAVNLPGGGKSTPDTHSVASEATHSSDGSEMAGLTTGSVGSSRSNAMRELRERIQRERQQVMIHACDACHYSLLSCPFFF